MTRFSTFFALFLAIVMVCALVPMTAFAEASDWDPLTDPDTVEDKYAGAKTFRSTRSLEAGGKGALLSMPILNFGIVSFNAMAYCGAKAVSNDTDILTVDGIQIGKVQGGTWDGADALQVNVTAKKAGTATVTINYYYTFSTSGNPFTNPNAKWFYGTHYFTVTVTEPSSSGSSSSSEVTVPAAPGDEELSNEEDATVDMICTSASGHNTQYLI